jgi:multiple sugar transport system substrate-binding protein
LLVQQLKSERAIPSPNTPAYTVISKAFAEAVDNIIQGADVTSELTRAALTIDQDINAHNGYSVQKSGEFHP